MSVSLNVSHWWAMSSGWNFVIFKYIYLTAGHEKSVPSDGPLVIKDCTVVYVRSKLQHSTGRALFNMQGQGFGSGDSSITFRNIVHRFTGSQLPKSYLSNKFKEYTPRIEPRNRVQIKDCVVKGSAKCPTIFKPNHQIGIKTIVWYESGCKL